MGSLPPPRHDSLVSQFRIDGRGCTSGPIVGHTARHFCHSRQDLSPGSFLQFFPGMTVDVLAPPLRWVYDRSMSGWMNPRDRGGRSPHTPRSSHVRATNECMSPRLHLEAKATVTWLAVQRR
jgi:hypothetical protein